MNDHPSQRLYHVLNTIVDVYLGKLSEGQVKTLLALIRHANNKTCETFVTDAVVAAKTGRSKRSVIRDMEALVAAGFVETLNRPSPGKSIRKRLKLPSASGDTNLSLVAESTGDNNLSPDSDGHGCQTDGVRVTNAASRVTKLCPSRVTPHVTPTTQELPTTTTNNNNPSGKPAGGGGVFEFLEKVGMKVGKPHREVAEKMIGNGWTEDHFRALHREAVNTRNRKDTIGLFFTWMKDRQDEPPPAPKAPPKPPVKEPDEPPANLEAAIERVVGTDAMNGVINGMTAVDTHGKTAFLKSLSGVSNGR